MNVFEKLKQGDKQYKKTSSARSATLEDTS